jgi:mannosyl-oligosaccharide glucosidase
LVTEGPDAELFKARIGKTHILGQPVPAGNIWKAKGKVIPPEFHLAANPL